MRRFMLILGLCMTGMACAAGQGSVHNYYFGGGFGYNKVPEFTEAKTELQLLAGYSLGERYGLDPSLFGLALEAGYMDTSDVDHDGFWLTPVLFVHVGPLTDLFVRGGAEAGHDNGVVYGAGAAYQIERNMAVRLEYVEHPHAHSLQVNVVYHPWAY